MTIDAQVGKQGDDVAVAACEVIGSRECPLPLLVYRPERWASAIAEIDSSQTREQVQGALFHSRTHEVVTYWEVLKKAVRGATSSPAIASHAEAIMRCVPLHGMDGELSVSRLNQVCVHTKDRIAWLDQPKVIAMAG